jgi:hypothetical protein
MVNQVHHVAFVCGSALLLIAALWWGRAHRRAVLGPGSYPEGAPFASAPGTIHENPPAGLLSVFETRLRQIMGPHRDQSDPFLTAFAPVTDHHMGQTLLVIEIDCEARRRPSTNEKSKTPNRRKTNE